MCLVCSVTYVPGLHPDADQHGLRTAQLPQAPARARVRGPAQLGAALLGVAARSRAHRRGPGNGVAGHVDGARRLATRGRSAAGRRASRLVAATAPLLNRRMSRRTGAPQLESGGCWVWAGRGDESAERWRGRRGVESADVLKGVAT